MYRVWPALAHSESTGMNKAIIRQCSINIYHQSRREAIVLWLIKSLLVRSLHRILKYLHASITGSTTLYKHPARLDSEWTGGWEMRTVHVMAMSRVKVRSAGCTCAQTANTSKTNRELLQLALGPCWRKEKKSLIFTSWHVYWHNRNSWKSKRTPARRSPNTRFVVLCSAPALITVQWSLDESAAFLAVRYGSCQSNWNSPSLNGVESIVLISQLHSWCIWMMRFPCVPVLCALHWLNLFDRSGASQKSSHAHIAGRCQVFD